jgi:hypothetical protein
MLGDNPDVMDVSMRFTPSISYLQSRNTFTVAPAVGVEETGNDFRFVMREAFLEMSNVFKSAPEITFWAGQRFYDRQQIEPMDYYWLDMSGYGAGVKNVDLVLANCGSLTFSTPFFRAKDRHRRTRNGGWLFGTQVEWFF